MESQILERKFRELEQSLQEFKTNWGNDMQLIKMMLMGCLGMQLFLFILLIFNDSLLTMFTGSVSP